MSESTQVETTKAKLPQAYTEGGMGLEDVGVEDYKQGYLSLLHPLSKAIEANDNLKAGQIINSETGEVVGGKGKPVEIYVVGFKKYWSETTKGDEETTTKYPLDSTNFMLPWDDGEVKRVPLYEMYCFEKGVTSGYPLVMSFRGTSANAAKGMLSFLSSKKANIFDWCFAVDSAQKKNKADQPYWYLTAKPTEQTTFTGEGVLDFVIERYNQVKAQKVTEKVPF